ncbi:putative flavin-containing monooxygenase [Caenibius tardaugens NBRC 16725]|uniref:Trimethylamine monooxygenase n=1 Tax=Caenibius tardaugens NBRC 16725 TaxID=1219035 RepID=U2ZXR0_9SPHN|nr:NAD(P)/FAD-dependent oxidoreductase [Caenibius tardaugens]AZI35538.1 NAD(P)/FAD-dependent oxidoreductase [Caenibius tardaugens NBRC 16725]GAD50184.1 putative flavin-containing monooxygenase [Caenibius tardaugens NBRC 16725]
MVERVAIIGAGISGLCTAKLLLKLGYDVQVFDKDAEVGGVWAGSRRYPGLATQNPKETYAFSDFPMPDHYPEWPSGAQMQAYLQAYADHFGVTPCLSLQTEVRSAEPLPNGAGWTVTTAPAGQAAAPLTTREFDWLLVCNGIFSIPSVPAYPGIDAFRAAGGTVQHTSEFTRLEDARGKHVVVVGYGKSSCDVANATVGISAHTTLLARHLIWKIPKLIGGTVNFKHLFLTRMGEALFPYIEVRGFERFLHGPGRFLRNGMLNLVQGIISRQLNLGRIGLEPRTPLETIARSTVSLVSDGFYDKIESGAMSLLEDEIVELAPGEVRLKSGVTRPADIIVCGTGWDQCVSFLPDAIRSQVTDSRGNFRLYRSTVPLSVPRLAFNGYNSSFFSQLSAEVGSFWIAEYMAGRVTIPDAQTQNAWIDRRLSWMDQRTNGKHCKGTNIVPFSLHHIDEILGDIDLTLPAHVRLGQWFKSVDARQFGHLSGKLIARRQAQL